MPEIRPSSHRPRRGGTPSHAAPACAGERARRRVMAAPAIPQATEGKRQNLTSYLPLVTPLIRHANPIEFGCELKRSDRPSRKCPAAAAG
jgi:hypothetical protein